MELKTDASLSWDDLTGENVKEYMCPGRVNLIGEHIDYNGGHVFPAALTIGIRARVRKRNDGIVRLSSSSLPGTFILNLKEDFSFNSNRSWANYPAGVLAGLRSEGYDLQGADVVFQSNLPDGAGLSSSAAIEVLTAYAFLLESGYPEPDRTWLARFSQGVENQYIGVNCGIMDQFSVAQGKKDHGILLNCQTLEFRQVPLILGDFRLVILNTNKRRELAESKYNERRSECEKALTLINAIQEFPDLCSVPLELAMNCLKDPILKARAKHVITENQRVLEACQVLETHNLVRFGELLNESHFSLRHDYEVTGKELDAITDAARSHDACLGVRMTGAGFGGCAIALVEDRHVPEFCAQIGDQYHKKTGLVADFYISEIGDGVRQLDHQSS
jgi:galactokinase